MTPIFRDLNLDSGSQRVLIIEDDRRWRDELFFLISSLGHEVDRFDGIARVAPTPLIATCDAATFEIDLSVYDVAFLDYYFLGGVANGGDLVQSLAEIGRARIMGMSSDAGANARMVALGAHIALRKSEARAQLLGLR